MKAKFLLTVFFFFPGCAVTLKQGVIVPPYPMNTNASRGVCIGENAGYKTCEFAIGILEMENSIPIVAISEEAIVNKDDSRPQWVVRDTVPFPKFSKRMNIEYGSCRYEGKEDNTIIALVPEYNQNSPEFIKAKDWAYKVKLPSGKFIKLDPEKVDCANTAIGAD